MRSSLRKRSVTACAVALLVIAAGSSAQEQTDTAEVPKALVEFLDAWLVAGDQEEKVMTYFSTSEQAKALAPDNVWALGRGARVADVLRSGNRSLLDSVTLGPELLWAEAAGPAAEDARDVVAPDEKMVREFETQLGVRVVSEMSDPYLVFIVDTDTAIRAFDGAEKGAAEILRPAETPTLGMVVGGGSGPDSSPFISFWQQEGEKSDWRIQMVGMLMP